MLNANQIHVLLDIVQRQTVVFAATTLGPEILSDQDKLILKENGLDYAKLYDESKDLVSLNFHLGLLSKILSSSQIQSMTFDQLNKYIQSGQYIPLNARERATVQSIKMQSMADIRSANQRIFRDVNNVVAQEFGNARADQQEYLRDQIATGIGDRKSRRVIAREIAKLTGDWSRDFNKSVQYISHTALNEGRAAMVHRRHDGDNEKAKVYFQVQSDACDHCVNLYLTGGPGSQPIIFSLKDLESNGSNIGRKAKEWVATVGPIHVNSLTQGKTVIFTDNGWRQIRHVKVGDYVLTHKGRFKKVISTLMAKAGREYCNQKVIVINYKITDRKGVAFKKISVTDEHKILTQYGWIKAGELMSGVHKLIKLQQPCSCGCGKYVDVIDSGRMTYSKKCKAKISARNAKKLAINEIRNQKLSDIAIQRWKDGKCENTLKYIQSDVHRELTRLRMLNGGAIKAMKAASSRKTSKVQVKLFEKVKQVFPEAQLEYEIFGKSLDIAIPSLRVDIEYDGSIWHNRPKNMEADKKRDELLKSNGWHVIRYVDSVPGLKRINEDVIRVANNSNKQYNFVEIEIDRIDTKPAYNHKNQFDLYDIGVEEDESFVARGIVIHNCRCLLTEHPEGSEWNGIKFVQKKTSGVQSTRPKVRILVNGEEFWV